MLKPPSGLQPKPQNNNGVHEPHGDYLLKKPPEPCKGCEGKDIAISSLQQHVKTLDRFVDRLEEDVHTLTEELTRYRSYFHDLRAPGHDANDKGQKS